MDGDVERLRAEVARLRAEVERLRRPGGSGTLSLDEVFPAFPALLFLFDGADRFVDFRAGSGLFAPPDAFLGRRVGEVLPEPAAGDLGAAMARARESGQAQRVDYGLAFPDGPRSFEATVLPLADGRLAALCTDVSAQRAAAEAARRQGEELAHLLSLSPSVVYRLEVGPAGAAIVGVSANLERVLGWSSAEVLEPGFWAEHVHPDDRAEAFARGAKVATEGRVVHAYRFRHRDGAWRWVRDESRLVGRGEGGTLEVVGAFSDVTAEREAEDRLRESEERFRALIERSPHLLAVFDAGGHISYASPASLELLGYTAEALAGRHAHELVVAEDRPKADAFLSGLVKRPGAAGILEVRLRKADGSTVVFESMTRNLLDVPSVRGIVLNSRDVTEERRLAAQAIQSQKLESVGRLAGGVAHDFNNLLVAILGYAEILERDLRAGQADPADAAEIRKAGERARDLVQQLLAFARRQVSQPEVVDLAASLRDSEKLLRRVIGEDVDLVIEAPGAPVAVRIDPTHLQQVVLNLAVNARDAMLRGGKLTLEVARVELDEAYAASHEGVEAGPHALLAVSDSGEGMSPEVQAHLFEPFFTTKPSGVGTGLGLSTVYGIVKQAGGHLWVYSELGRGTTFKIYLPLTPEPVGVAPGAPPRPAPGARGPETVLVVEDDAAVRELTVRALREGGYRVLAAGGGQAALDLAGAEGPIHLVVTDVVMPGLSGRQVADRLRQLHPGLQVLFVSGYTQNTIVHHGVLDAGVQFLAKPFTPGVLLRKVRSVLDGA